MSPFGAPLSCTDLLYVVCLAASCFISEVFGLPPMAGHNAEGAQEIRVVLHPPVKSVEVFCSTSDGTIRNAAGL